MFLRNIGMILGLILFLPFLGCDQSDNPLTDDQKQELCDVQLNKNFYSCLGLSESKPYCDVKDKEALPRCFKKTYSQPPALCKTGDYLEWSQVCFDSCVACGIKSETCDQCFNLKD